MPKVKRAKAVRVTKKQKTSIRNAIKGSDGMPVTEISTYGTEPMPLKDGVMPNMNQALNWYSRYKSYKDADKYLIDFAKQYGFNKDEISLLRKCPAHFVNSSYGWLAKMSLNGIKLDDSQLNRIIVKIREKINHAIYIDNLNTELQAESDSSVKKSIHQVMKEAMNDKASAIMGTIDGWLDDFCDAGMSGEFDLYSYLQSVDAKPAHVAIVEDRLGVWYAEFIAARDGLDPDFVEGYSHLTPVQLKTLTHWVEDLRSQASNYVNVTKSARGPKRGSTRVKKVDPVKQTARLETVSIQGVQSLDKTQIIGANELWVVDQWGGIRWFKSETTTGFDMSGRKLKNISDAVFYRMPMRSNADKEVFTQLLKKGFPKKVRERKQILDQHMRTDKLEEISPSIAKTLIWHVA